QDIRRRNAYDRRKQRRVARCRRRTFVSRSEPGAEIRLLVRRESANHSLPSRRSGACAKSKRQRSTLLSCKGLAARAIREILTSEQLQRGHLQRFDRHGSSDLVRLEA